MIPSVENNDAVFDQEKTKKIRFDREDMAEDFAESMRKCKLSPSTINKRIKTARQIFNAMIREKITHENPFQTVKVTPTIDQERNVYVERERVERIIDSIPDPEWKLIIGLSRYCGLRAPSEILSLTWDCILWDKKRMIVKSSKTEHYEGKDSSWRVDFCARERHTGTK